MVSATIDKKTNELVIRLPLQAPAPSTISCE
jgi:hypothetical protein